MPDYVKVFTIKGGDGQERRMELPLQLDVDRPKRPRTTFHADQLQALEMAFQTATQTPKNALDSLKSCAFPTLR
ncbi:unnamed protein product, partial [Mesorhabditis spiculigera]